MDPLRKAHLQHSRHWRDFQYVYPVIARRSRGLSLGINLSPDQACNFNCIYCCVNRPGGRRAHGPRINLSALETELLALAENWPRLFEEPPFAGLPAEVRRLNDFAFSGDGEPTAAPVFPQAVSIAASVRRTCRLGDVKLVLITNATHLGRPAVVAALRELDANHGEIWAKLDAGTQAWFERVTRTRMELDHVLRNILAAAQVRPIVIQSLFMAIDGQPPPAAEVDAYLGRLRGLLAAGAQIKLVQVYTVARNVAVSSVAPLPEGDLERIAARIKPLGVPSAVFA